MGNKPSKICNENEMLKISDSIYVDPDIFREYICSLNLGIDIDLATDEEWVITAKSDNLRNPLTNIPFSDNELIYIFNKLSTSKFKEIKKK
jgi:hypothetical protein